MTENETGFPKFQKRAFQTLGPLLTAARSFIPIGKQMTSASVSGQMPDVAKQIAQTVANSMESVLVLVSNGCGVDALKVARTMFEAAVTLHYLDTHPELVEDFIDFLWIVRKRHADYRLASHNVIPMSPETAAETETNYQRVKDRFADRKGRIRNSWCKATLREMAREVGGEFMYGGIYPFGSSMTHTDILAIVAGAGDSGDVEPVPSCLNLTLALQTSVLSFAMALTAFDKIANLGRGDDIEAAFTDFKNASTVAQKPVSESDIAVCAYYLWEQHGRPIGSPDIDWFEAERRLKGRS